MRLPCARLAWVTVAVGVASSGISAAQTCLPAPLWQLPAQLPSTITQVASDTPFGAGLSFFAYGPTVYAVWNEASTGPPAPHAGGAIAWTWSAGTPIENFPSPVLLSNGGEYLFVGGSDGFLYKIDVATGLTAKSVDTRRAVCAADRITATPAVQLYAASNSTFQSQIMMLRGHPDDLVFVVTHNGNSSDVSSGCYGGSTKNRIRAYYASDLTLKWTFNSTGAYSMDYGSEACAIDYVSNRLYCGTNQGTPSQNTLWAINSLNGAPVWAVNAGSIQSRPQFGQGELYVASTDGTLQKWAPDGDGFGNGILLWAYASGAPLLRSPSVEFRSPSPTRVFFVDTFGELHGVQDGSAAGVALWPPVSAGGGHFFSTFAAVMPGLGKVYVGRDDGAVQQIDIAGGTLETLAQPVGAVAAWDPSVDLSSAGAPGVDRLMVPYPTGAVARFCIPWIAPTAVTEPTKVVDYALAQNAPNPFSADTRLSYTLPQAARVEIDVYDVAGHRVRALLREDEGAGPHNAVWNGLDDAGTPAPSGLYFCRLRAVGVSGQTLERSRKLHLVR